MNAAVGLCAACTHARTLVTRSGSRFWLCGLSQTDPRYPRYPPLPVLRCAGYTPGRPDDRPQHPLEGDPDA